MPDRHHDPIFSTQVVPAGDTLVLGKTSTDLSCPVSLAPTAPARFHARHPAALRSTAKAAQLITAPRSARSQCCSKPVSSWHAHRVWQHRRCAGLPRCVLRTCGSAAAGGCGHGANMCQDVVRAVARKASQALTRDKPECCAGCHTVNCCKAGLCLGHFRPWHSANGNRSQPHPRRAHPHPEALTQAAGDSVSMLSASDLQCRNPPAIPASEP